MKINEINLNENDNPYNILLDNMNEYALNYLEDISHGTDNILYHNSSAVFNYKEIKMEKHRDPKDTPLFYHNLFNEKFMELFGSPLRSTTLFASTKPRHEYGPETYVIIPMSPYKFYYSPRVYDLFSNIKKIQVQFYDFLYGAKSSFPKNQQNYLESNQKTIRNLLFTQANIIKSNESFENLTEDLIRFLPDSQEFSKEDFIQQIIKMYKNFINFKVNKLVDSYKEITNTNKLQSLLPDTAKPEIMVRADMILLINKAFIRSSTSKNVSSFLHRVLEKVKNGE